MIVSLITSGILLLSVYDLPLSTATMNCLQLCLNNSKIFSINSVSDNLKRHGLSLLTPEPGFLCRLVFHFCQCGSNDLFCVIARIQPIGSGVRRQQHRHTGVDKRDARGRVSGQDGKRRDDHVVMILQMVDACQIQRIRVCGANGVFRPRCAAPLPLEVVAGGDDAASLAHSVFEHGLLRSGFRAGVDDGATVGECGEPGSTPENNPRIAGKSPKEQ